MARMSYVLVCGPMFAGKTTSLINSYRSARERGDAVLILAPQMDTRHAGTRIVSHAGDQAGPIIRIRDEKGLVNAVSGMPKRKSLTILVDECQFMDVGYSGDFLASLMFALSNRDGDVLIVFHGLDLDARRQPWPMTDRIRYLPGIQEVKLMSQCAFCGSPAPYTDRHSKGDVVEVGGSETYFPACEQHYGLKCDAVPGAEALLEKVA